MKAFKVGVFLGLLLCVGGANLAWGTFEPELTRNVALKQFESDDASRQQLRALTTVRQQMLYAIDASVPIAFVALFGGDLLNALSVKKEKEES